MLTIAEDRSGGLWLGTGAGLAVLRSGRVERPALPGVLDSVPVTASLRLRHGALLFGSAKAIARYDGRSFTVLSENQGLEIVTGLAEGTAHDLWTAVFGVGLRHMTAEGEPLDDVPELPSADVTAVRVTFDGTVWIGTYGAGLLRLRDGRMTSFTRKEGLPDDVVYSILPEEGGRTLWVGCNLGIYRVAAADLDAVASGASGRVPVLLLGEADGMRSRECNGGQQPAAWRGQDGRLWFATAKGVAEIDPRQLAVSRPPPAARIESLAADGRTIPLPAVSEEAARIPAGRGRLSFRFTAPSFLRPDRLRFRYRLGGVDGDWIDGGTARVADYTRVPPGRHTFSVTAGNAEGVFHPVPAQLTIYIAPHFYQTWWFLGLCLAAVGAAIAASYRLRVHQVRATERRLARLVDERTRELEQARRSLEENNRTLERRIEEGIAALRDAERMAAYGRMVAAVAHEVRHPIFAMQAAAYVLNERMRGDRENSEQIEILEREAKRMTALMNDLLEVARPMEIRTETVPVERLLEEAESAFRDAHGADGLPVERDVGNGVPAVIADPRRMQQVFVNLMENAQKHAKGATRVVLEVRRGDRPHTVRFSVIDDGGGIPEERLPHVFEPFHTGGRGTGLGLAIVKRIVEAHQGSIEVECPEAGGTRFTIVVPAATSEASSRPE